MRDLPNASLIDKLYSVQKIAIRANVVNKLRIFSVYSNVDSVVRYYHSAVDFCIIGRQPVTNMVGCA